MSLYALIEIGFLFFGQGVYGDAEGLEFFAGYGVVDLVGDADDAGAELGAVVGGGPGGMTAARTAALRGHM